jgi:transcription antitermination factor NusG
MNRTELDQQWYVVRVKPRHEKAVGTALRAKQYEEFLPLYKSKRRWADRLKDIELPLFPGYVFCRFNPLFRVPVLNTPGVIDILRIGSTLAPVEEHEIEALQVVMAQRLCAQPWEYLHVGQAIIIQEGPLRGLSGIILDFKRPRRLVLSVSLLQRSVLVEIDPAQVSDPETVIVERVRTPAPLELKAKAG